MSAAPLESVALIWRFAAAPTVLVWFPGEVTVTVAPPPTTAPPTSPTPTPTSGGGGSCYTAWNSTTTYYNGAQVSYNSVNYTAIYVSTGVAPGSAIAWNIWKSDGAC